MLQYFGWTCLHLPSRCSAPCSLQQQPSHSSTLLSQPQLPTSLSADMLLPCLKLNHLEKSTAAWKAQGKPKKVGCCSEMGGRDEVLRCKWSVRPVGAAAAPTQHHSPPSSHLRKFQSIQSSYTTTNNVLCFNNKQTNKQHIPLLTH